MKAALAGLLVGALAATAIADTAQAIATRPPVRVMPLGDSLTYGIGSPTRSGYRIELQGRLKAAGARVDFVGSQHAGRCCDTDNEGHPGWTTAQIRDHVASWMHTYRPDIVLLMIGTNDITHGSDEHAAAARLAVIIARIRAVRPLAHIFVALIPHTTAASANRRTDRYNAYVAQVVAHAGPRVYPVDMSVISTAHLVDSRHFDDDGYSVMARQWYEGFRRWIAGASAWSTSARPSTKEH